MNGILLIDKPRGWTSFDVVNFVRKLVAAREGKRPKQVKVGHTGTLDPLATGLLVLLIGDYTKRAPGLTKLDKTYDVVMKLGQTSTTGDEEGEKSSGSPHKPAQTEIIQAFEKFTGEIMQTPPAYSAVKIGGQRAYKLARAGQQVAIEPRKVTISAIECKKYDYPMVEFRAHVSSGTYIRSLVQDIGGELGTGAYMTDLRRTAVGPFELAQAQSVKGAHLLENIKL